LASTITAADGNVVIAISSGNLTFWLVAGETISSRYRSAEV